MNRHERARSFRGLPTDEEVDRLRGLEAGAEPGEWYARGDAPTEITRYDGTPVREPASLRFMAAARGAVPALLRWVDALSEDLRAAWHEIDRLKAERRERAECHERELTRASAGQTGKLEELELIVEACAVGAYGRAGLRAHVERWARGEELHREISFAIDLQTHQERVRKDFHASQVRELESLRDQVKQQLAELAAARGPARAARRSA